MTRETVQKLARRIADRAADRKTHLDKRTVRAIAEAEAGKTREVKGAWRLAGTSSGKRIEVICVELKSWDGSRDIPEIACKHVRELLSDRPEAMEKLRPHIRSILSSRRRGSGKLAEAVLEGLKAGKAEIPVMIAAAAFQAQNAAKELDRIEQTEAGNMDFGECLRIIENRADQWEVLEELSTRSRSKERMRMIAFACAKIGQLQAMERAIEEESTPAYRIWLRCRMVGIQRKASEETGKFILGALEDLEKLQGKARTEAAMEIVHAAARPDLSQAREWIETAIEMGALDEAGWKKVREISLAASNWGEQGESSQEIMWLSERALAGERPEDSFDATTAVGNLARAMEMVDRKLGLAVPDRIRELALDNGWDELGKDTGKMQAGRLAMAIAKIESEEEQARRQWRRALEILCQTDSRNQSMMKVKVGESAQERKDFETAWKEVRNGNAQWSMQLNEIRDRVCEDAMHQENPGWILKAFGRKQNKSGIDGLMRILDRHQSEIEREEYEEYED